MPEVALELSATGDGGELSAEDIVIFGSGRMTGICNWTERDRSK